MNKSKNIIFFVSMCIIILFLVWFTIYSHDYIKDCIFALIALGVIYLLEKKYPLQPIYLILIIIPLMLNIVGLAFNFFSFYVLGIGYDKMIHFLNSALITLVIYSWISSSKNTVIKLVMVMLMVLGMGAICEILEFVGQTYLHIYGPTMFSQGDLLPTTLVNDLVKYDSSWDLIFDFFGTVFMAILIWLRIVKVKTVINNNL